MSANQNPTNSTTAKHRPLKELIGRTVSYANFIQDQAGYDTVWIEFDDGSELWVREQSQAGEMEVEIQ
jgi:hypothetical protein